MKFASALLALLAGSSTAQTILDIVVASEDHNTLEAAVLAAPAVIAETLGNPEATLTLFAPDDTAFSNLIAEVGQDYVDDLLTEPWASHLSCLLLTHVLGSVVPSSAVTEEVDVETLSGYNVTAEPKGMGVTVEDIPVTTADINGTNGLIHVISESPILPGCVSDSIFDLGEDDVDFSTLISLVEAAGLEDALTNMRPLTLFAPTNDAFAAVPADVLDYLGSNVTALTEVLTYHVVNANLIAGPNAVEAEVPSLQGEPLSLTTDGTVNVNEVPVLLGDLLASNGVVHVIGSVLLPPSLALPATMSPVTMAPATASPVAPVMPATDSILDIVVASPDHMTLEAAVLAAPAAIAELLGNDTGTLLTLFAPDDAAFGQLTSAVGQEYIDDLLTPAWAQHLACFLASHVVGSVIPSSAVTGETDVETLSGYVVTAELKDGMTITIEDSPVTTADIMATNGIVHVISELPIVPTCVADSIFKLGSDDPMFSTLVSLVEAANLTNVLSTTRPLTLFAPTNDAFAAVPAEVLDYLGSNVTALTEVLTYHVASGNLYSSGITMNVEVPSVQGDMINITIGDAGVSINDAPLVTPDVLASNGVVHIIGGVLLPPSLVLPELAPTTTSAPVPAVTPAPVPALTTPAPTTSAASIMSTGSIRTLLLGAIAATSLFVL